MKLTRIIAAAMAFTAVIGFNSCKSAETEKQAAENEEITAVVEESVTEDSADKLTAAEKTALLDSKLVTEEDFGKTIFIDFNATWCGPCREFAPYFEAAAKKFGNEAKFIAVDIDEYRAVADAFGIRSIPTMIAVKADGTLGVYVGTQGLVGEGAFEGIVNQYK